MSNDNENNNDNSNVDKNITVDVHVHLNEDQNEQIEASHDEVIEQVTPSVREEKAEIRSLDLDDLMISEFNGRIVRKDLTKQLKEGANVPVYVLEYLLGMYCSSAEDEQIIEGMKKVKKILADNYVRPDEAEKAKSLIREKGSYKIIDKVSVRLNQKKDIYEASLSNLGIKDAVVPNGIVKENEKLLTGGIWCIITLSYYYEEGQKISPFSVFNLKPIQMPSMNMDEIFDARRKFTMDQ